MCLLFLPLCENEANISQIQIIFIRVSAVVIDDQLFIRAKGFNALGYVDMLKDCRGQCLSKTDKNTGEEDGNNG